MEKKNKENILIVVAHPDDEVLGVAELLQNIKIKKNLKLFLLEKEQVADSAKMITILKLRDKS